MNVVFNLMNILLLFHSVLLNRLLFSCVSPIFERHLVVIQGMTFKHFCSYRTAFFFKVFPNLKSNSNLKLFQHRNMWINRFISWSFGACVLVPSGCKRVAKRNICDLEQFLDEYLPNLSRNIQRLLNANMQQFYVLIWAKIQINFKKSCKYCMSFNQV